MAFSGLSRFTHRVSSVRPCPLTGSHDAVVVATRGRNGNPLRNILSIDSGLIYVDPIPVEDLATFYREKYRVTYKAQSQPKPKHILRAGRIALERYHHSGQIARRGMRTLDIGAGGGEWVYLMGLLGCEAYGVEPDAGYSAFAKEHYGVDVFQGMHQESEFEPASFDLVTLFQVLEHLADPVEDLRQMGRYLKPGGTMLIEVPDILFPGMHFKHKWHTGHLFGFDALTLEAVAAKAGLRTRFISVLPGNLFGVFEKSEESTVPLPNLSGHAQRVAAAIQEGQVRYWTLFDTYAKVPRRLAKRLHERWVSSRATEPKEILDRVYQGVRA